ncbi:hypothetical protein ACWEKM_45780 [Streptomyces sp. NPDC004752]
MTTRHADGAYRLDLAPIRRAPDGVVTEYQIQPDRGQPTSPVWRGAPHAGGGWHPRPLVAGGAAPRSRAAQSFGIHRPGRRGPPPGADPARLPDGAWDGFSARRRVTTGPWPGSAP